MTALSLTPYSIDCGVVVNDLQLAELSETQLTALRDAFTEYGLLFFRHQKLSPEEHLRFARRMGTIVRNKFFKTVDGYLEIAEVRKDASQKTNIGGGWHTDHSYDKEPAMGSILVARTLPKSGGDTRFANLYAAYEALSPGLKNTLQTLRAIHSNEHIYGKDGYYSNTDMAKYLGGTDSVGRTTHPAVITHPASGRKALYVNPGHTLGFEGWSQKESAALLQYLYEHVDQQDFTCQFEWRPGSIAFWDNRCTWHFAQNDYQGQARLMHRITLAGSPLAST